MVNYNKLFELMNYFSKVETVNNYPDMVYVLYDEDEIVGFIRVNEMSKNYSVDVYENYSFLTNDFMDCFDYSDDWN